MNKKQLICMWCGILAIVFFGFATIVYGPDYANFCVWVFLLTLITGALILTFKDKKRPAGETIKPMNLKRGFERITILLSLLCALFFLTVGIFNFLYGEWNDVHSCLIGGLVSVAGVLSTYVIIFGVIVPIVMWLVKGFSEDSG